MNKHKLRSSDMSITKIRKNTSVTVETTNTTILDLPNEMLLKIMSYLDIIDLYCNIRLVCRNWFRLAPCSTEWAKMQKLEEIEAETENNLKSKILLIMLHLAGNNLKTLKLVERKDSSVILKKVAASNRKLECLHILACQGSARQLVIPSVPLCNLLGRCKSLQEISLVGSKVDSCKFFKIITTININKYMEHIHTLRDIKIFKFKGTFSFYIVYHLKSLTTISLNFIVIFPLKIT